MSSTGVDVLAQTSVLHGALVRGTSTELSELSSLSMVKHMEANVLIEHFYLPGDQNDTESMMHETVNWVNASLAWHRAIIDTNGVLKTEPDMLAISATMTSTVTLMAGRRRYSISRNPSPDYLTVQIKCGSGCGGTCGPWR